MGLHTLKKVNGTQQIIVVILERRLNAFIYQEESGKVNDP